MEFQPVKSQALKEAGYEDGEIGARFHNGSLFFYLATEDEFKAMLAAESVGKYFLTKIKPRGGSQTPRNSPPEREMPPTPTEEPLAYAKTQPRRLLPRDAEALPEGMAADPGTDPPPL